MDETPRLLALAAAVVLALVHLFGGGLRFLDRVPRSRWLSFAGGVSVAYVFVHLLPELAEGQERLSAAAGPVLGAIERHTYLVALAGLALFYGLERLALASRRGARSRAGEEGTSEPVFWIHIGAFAAYNALVGYLLVHREDGSAQGLALFAIAMALHFLVNDVGLRQHHKRDYHHRGRWIVAAAVLLGWAVGAATRIPEAAMAVLLAFLAGGVILNVLKEELPDERESRFGALLLGMAAYSALLLMA